MYFGLLLRVVYKDKSVWNRVIEMFEKHLASWKRQYLSKGSQNTIIKTYKVFCSIIYFNFADLVSK